MHIQRIVVSMLCLMLPLLALVLIANANHDRAYQFIDDLGMESLSDCKLQYYYYIPCPVESWFWALYGPPDGGGWEPGDVVGQWFQVGDMSTGRFEPCGPEDCQSLVAIQYLNLCTYGTTYPNINLVTFDIYCSDEEGCPIGPSLWQSETYRPSYGWQYVILDDPLSICPCSSEPGPPPAGLRILVTATHGGYWCAGPHWGADNISTPLEQGCEMHDVGCLSVLYPRPDDSYYDRVHSGYYGNGLSYCPPVLFKDGGDTTPGASMYGYIEMTWRLHLSCTGPTATRSTTWGAIKSMYR